MVLRVALLRLCVAVVVILVGTCAADRYMMLCPAACGASTRTSVDAEWLDTPAFSATVVDVVTKVIARSGNRHETLENVNANSATVLVNVLRSTSFSSQEPVHIVTFASMVHLASVTAAMQNATGSRWPWRMTVVVDTDSEISLPAAPRPVVTQLAVGYLVPWSTNAAFVAGSAAAAQSAANHVVLVLPPMEWAAQLIKAAFVRGVMAQNEARVRVSVLFAVDLTATIDALKDPSAEHALADVVVAVGKIANIAAYETIGSGSRVHISLFSNHQVGEDVATHFPDYATDTPRSRAYVVAVDTDMNNALTLGFVVEQLLLPATQAQATTTSAGFGLRGAPRFYFFGEESVAVAPCRFSCGVSVAYLTATQTNIQLKNRELSVDLDLNNGRAREPPNATTLQRTPLLAAPNSSWWGTQQIVAPIRHPPGFVFLGTPRGHAVLHASSDSVELRQLQPRPPAALSSGVASFFDGLPVPSNVAVTQLNDGRAVLHGGYRASSRQRLSHLYVVAVRNGAIEWANITMFQSTNTTEESPSLPAPRSQHTISANGSTHLIVYGGVCGSGGLHCNDMWSLDLLSRTWRRLQLPNLESGRVDHSAVVWDVNMTVNGVSDVRWLVVVGGERTTTFFRPAAFALHREQWVELPLPQTAPPMRLPCVFTTGSRLFVIGGTADGINLRSVLIFSARWMRWEVLLEDGEATVWPGGAASCSITTEYFMSMQGGSSNGASNANSTAAVGVSDSAQTLRVALHSQDAPASVYTFDYVSADCPANEGTIPSLTGTTCITCEPQNVVIDEMCVPCWQLDPGAMSVAAKRLCLERDSLGGIIGFIGIMVLQFLVVPMYSLFVMLQAGIERSRANKAAATHLAQALANFEFGRVAYLETVANPTRTQMALMECARNLQRVRLHFPAAIYAIIEAATRRGGREPAFSTSRADAQGDSASELPTATAVASGLSSNAFANSIPGLASIVTTDTSSTSQNDVNGERLNSTKRILRALKPQLAMREVSTLATQLEGFSGWAASHRDLGLLTRRFQRYADDARLHFLASGGVVEAIQGDRFIVSFNTTANATEKHRLRACSAAIKYAAHKSVTSLGLTCRMGLSTRDVPCGVVGSDSTKRYYVGSAVIKEAVALCETADKLNASFLVRSSAAFEAEVSEHLVYYFAAEGKIHELRHPSLLDNWKRDGETIDVAVAASSTSWADADDDEVEALGPRDVQNRALLAEVLGFTDDLQWTTVRRGHREYIGIQNRVSQLVFDGRLDEARRVDLRGLPTWFSSAAKMTLRRGALDSLDIVIR